MMNGEFGCEFGFGEFGCEQVSCKEQMAGVYTGKQSAPKYLCDHIQLPISASSLCPFHSSHLHDLFLPHVRTTMAQARSVASIGPSLLSLSTVSRRSC